VINETILKQLSLHNYVDGQRHVVNNARTVPTFDPATGEVLALVPVADKSVVDSAVAAACRAQASDWGRMLPAQRSRVLLRTAEGIRRSAEHLARVESLDSGKPMREAKGDIETAARYFEYYGGMADKLEGHTIPLGPDFVSMTFHEPVGVTAHIIPWNFPLVTTARGVAPCLAAGSSAVVKPAEETPLTTLMLADILAESGLPAGAYNVVCGVGEETGAALVAHPEIVHVTFTGSLATGKHVMQSAASHVASVTLELGGKSPVVVLADADLEAARVGVLKAIFTNSGQVCSAGSRLVVERSVADELIDSLTASIAAMKAGRGIDDPDLGPLISPAQLDRVTTMVAAARERGAQVLCGGNRMIIEGLEKGNFFEPTMILANDASDPIVQEEIFGPVLTVQIADDFDHAVALANGTQFGLVAGIYTRDVSRAFRFAKGIDAGQVFINQYFAGGVETPFGGTKASGFGREKGLEALRAYFRVKTVTAKI
jgi:acyl-CoA reductase-like NAD-dependent aldehyde dehydrogenase